MKVKCRAKLIEVINAAAAEAPEWVLLLPAGELHTTDGLTYLVDELAMQLILAAFQDRRVDLVIDYEHQTLNGEKAPAAGWIKELRADDDGIWARVEWTDRGRRYVESKEYRYLSPVILLERESGRVVEIMSVALTNVPRINDYPPIVNKSEGGWDMNFLERLKKLLGLDEAATEQDALKATERLANSYRGMVSALRTLAGLDEKAEPKAVLEAVKNKLQQAPGEGGKEGDAGKALIPNSVLSALGLEEGAGESEVVGAIKGLQDGSGQAGQLAQKLAQLENKLAQREAAELVANAMKEGKIAPAQQEWALDYATKDPAGFRAYVNAAPKVVPLDGVPAGGKPEGSGQTDDTQMQINRMLGIGEEVWKKHNPEMED